jgi:hypothetical protein
MPTMEPNGEKHAQRLVDHDTQQQLFRDFD